jgi:DNA integrity scanning protein DisA with diadenylate cyclase activity
MITKNKIDLDMIELEINNNNNQRESLLADYNNQTVRIENILKELNR